MKSLIVANWKCNPETPKGAKLLFNAVKRGIKNIKNVEVVICPPFVYLPFFQKKIKKIEKIKLGAQDVFWKEKGAFTGEISPLMLKDLGVKYVIIGHSERRQILKETDEMINKKLRAVLFTKLRPILCVGETEMEKRKEQGLRVLNSQISRALEGVPEKEADKIILAYEPVWAIGTGAACEPNSVLEKKLLLQRIFRKRYSPNISKKLKILYGGSVTPENALSYIKEAKTNGLLIGGSSLKAKEFLEIVKMVSI